MATLSHCSQRDGTSRGSSSDLGSFMEVLDCSSFLGQHAVVCALSSGAAKDSLLMYLLRCLHFFSTHYQRVIKARHIAGMHNTAADALSRDKQDVFSSRFPQAPLNPSPLPQSLLDMLLHTKPDWTPPVGGNCYSLPWKGTSSRHALLIWLWSVALSNAL